ncbi:hypothetical protein OS493_018520 [Desmophyllum pertusum]|uniref:Uncharacterized protein n=1 Tax=Desmophyllum pertusum TaxID=174260 RepID=A0A9X0A0Y6_9CNID|nr:hypothetical protein OS493_018520 [Desmophyllum pertusum]
MHEVVANFMCKLMETRPFSHLKARMSEDEVKRATDNWVPGERATKKLVDWCQDQWRRKKPCYPKKPQAYFSNEPCTMPWFDDMPVCFNCGFPCPECRAELGLDIPTEMSTAHAIMNFEEIHNASDVTVSLDQDNGMPSSASTQPSSASQQPSSSAQLQSSASQQPSSALQQPSASRMKLRSSRKQN